jgi:hypothetical protein
MKIKYLLHLYKKIDELGSSTILKSKRESRVCRKRQELALLEFSPNIIPDRYVWQVSYPCYRESIIKNGIQSNFKDNNSIFVNNQLEKPHLLWPIIYNNSGKGLFGAEPSFYQCRKGNIPVEAKTLYRYRPGSSIKYYCILNKGEVLRNPSYPNIHTQVNEIKKNILL